MNIKKKVKRKQMILPIVFAILIIIFIILMFFPRPEKEPEIGLPTVGIWSGLGIKIPEQEINYSGFVIELEQEPLITKKTELEKAQLEQTPSFSAQSDIKNKLENHKEKLKTEKAVFKDKIIEKLNQNSKLTGNVIYNPNTLPVLAEYENTINAIAINITKEQAFLIKDLPEIRAIHPNIIVQANLNDSIPLLGADYVWTLKDTFGNNITGKGVTIGIIDTGIDYLHEDFSGAGHPEIGQEIINQTNGEPMYTSIFEDIVVYASRNISSPRFLGQALTKIYALNLTSKQETLITDYEVPQYYPKIHKNKIVWQSNKTGLGYDIFMYDLNTKTETQITNDIQIQTNPEIYEDIIIWKEEDNEEIRIYMYNITSKIKTPISDPAESRSPASQKIYKDLIIWIGWKNEELKIFLYNITENNLSILENSGSISEIHIHNNKIIAREVMNYQVDLFLYDLETNNKTQITNTPAYEYYNKIYDNKIIWYETPNTYMYDLSTKEKTQITCSSDFEGMAEIYEDSLIWARKKGIFSLIDQVLFLNLSDFNKNTCVFEFPTQKVIGGHDFVNNDDYPLDDNGHGTHCASIATGKGDYNKNNIYEPELGEVWGVAPDAKLYAYKVLNSGGSGTFAQVISGIERSTDPNQDGDFSDHLDVISLSLGGNCGGNYNENCGPDDIASKAIDSVVDLGVIAVISAGNSGPDNATIGTPGTARQAITVGASYNKDEAGSRAELIIPSHSNKKIKANPLTKATPKTGLIGNLTYAKQGLEADFEAKDFTNKIALVEITFIEQAASKATLAENAGATGIIFIPIRDELKEYIVDFTNLSLAYVNSTDGDYLNSSVKLGDVEILINITNNPNDIAFFSSRGPIEFDSKILMKPDIVAPGVSICAAQLENAWYGRECIDDNHVSIRGTSMAAPHVAGAAALLIQKFPDWNPENIKNAIKTTATDLNLPENIQGAGRLNLFTAINILEKPITSKIFTSGIVQGTIIPIIGTVQSSTLLEYNLSYSNETSKNFTQICTSTQKVVNSTLCNWNISNLSDGIYNLKLESRTSLQKTAIYGQITIKNTQITYPEHESISNTALPTWENTTINGSASGAYFQNYEITLQNNKTKAYLPQAIILENSGLQLVENNTLGRIDSSKILESGFYNLTLITHYNGKPDNQDSKMIYIETQFQTGWPQKYDVEGYLFNYIKGQPLITDMNKDNKKDIIIAQGKTISIFNYNGTLLKGWPFTINTTFPEIFDFADCLLYFSPAIGDINNDGYKEIIIADSCGHVHALDYQGNYIFEPKKLESKLPYWFLQAISLGDINNDGYLEIIIPSSDPKINVLDYQGNHLPGWPRELQIAGNPSYHRSRRDVSIADLNYDGFDEIIFSSYVCFTESCSPWEGEYTMVIWILNYTGENHFNWQKNFSGGGGYEGAFTLADIDSDAELEIITDDLNGQIHVLNLDGTETYLWPDYNNLTYSIYYEESSISDIDLDGELEIIRNSAKEIGRSIKYCTFVYTNDGNIYPNFPVCEDDFTEIRPSLSQTTGNIDNDPELEIIYGKSYNDYKFKELYAINHDGTIVNGFPKYTGRTSISATYFVNYPIEDLDNDGDNELIVVKPYDFIIYVYDTPGQADSNNFSWNQYHYDIRNTGTYTQLKRTYFADADKDTYGNYSVSIKALETENDVITIPGTSDDYVTNNLDCNDNDAGIWQILQIYIDSDGDGYGTGSATQTCHAYEIPEGYANNSDDCNDSNKNVWKIIQVYFDEDRDGYGAGEPLEVCYDYDLPNSYVINNEDCDDTNLNINPGKQEICDDNIDNNCNFLIDEGCGGSGPGGPGGPGPNPDDYIQNFSNDTLQNDSEIPTPPNASTNQSTPPSTPKPGIKIIDLIKKYKIFIMAAVLSLSILILLIIIISFARPKNKTEKSYYNYELPSLKNIKSK